MIILDTHIWIWWVNESPRLTEKQKKIINENQSSGLGISIISCWEVAKLVEKKRLVLSIPVEEWLEQASTYPGVKLLELSIPILVESTQLKGFHNDPADQIIVATARVNNSKLLTADGKILKYSGVKTFSQ